MRFMVKNNNKINRSDVVESFSLNSWIYELNGIKKSISLRENVTEFQSR